MYTMSKNPSQTVFKIDDIIFNFANVCRVEQECNNPEVKAKDNSIRIYTVDGECRKFFGWNIDTFWDFLFGEK
jgi:hypothetical protein